VINEPAPRRPPATTGARSALVRALRIHSKGDLRLDWVPEPEAAPDQAVVDVCYGGVCGSDIHYWRDGSAGTSILRGPMVLGHEIVGRVAVPAGDGSGPAAGTAVAVHPARTCGRCRWCTSGAANLCPDGRYLGSAAQWPHTDGGFADQIAVPSSRLVPIPETLGLRRASLAEPAGIAWHATDRAQAVGAAVAGANVIIVGGGPIGLLVAAVARYRSAATVTVTDVHELPLALAAAIGADSVVPAGDLAREPGRIGADIAFESSGSPAGLATAIRAARRGGTVVVVGQPPAGDVPVPASLCVAHELTMTGSLRMESELDEAVAFLADSRAHVDPIVTDFFPAGRAAEAFALAADPARSSKVLLDFSA
jgi:threonine dehydrogenase-like Zn-dependent dehydrogenase